MNIKNSVDNCADPNLMFSMKITLQNSTNCFKLDCYNSNYGVIYLSTLSLHDLYHPPCLKKEVSFFSSEEKAKLIRKIGASIEEKNDQLS